MSSTHLFLIFAIIAFFIVSEFPADAAPVGPFDWLFKALKETSNGIWNIIRKALGFAS